MFMKKVMMEMKPKWLALCLLNTEENYDANKAQTASDPISVNDYFS